MRLRRLRREGSRGPSRTGEEDEVKDGFRLRGGFSVNGGVMVLPNSRFSPAFGFAGRLGLQFNHYFGIVYQNTPIVTLTVQDSSSGRTSARWRRGASRPGSPTTIR